MGGSFAPHVGARQETELVVDKGKELVDSLAAFGLAAQSLLGWVSDTVPRLR